MMHVRSALFPDTVHGSDVVCSIACQLTSPALPTSYIGWPAGVMVVRHIWCGSDCARSLFVFVSAIHMCSEICTYVVRPEISVQHHGTGNSSALQVLKRLRHLQHSLHNLSYCIHKVQHQFASTSERHHQVSMRLTQCCCITYCKPPLPTPIHQNTLRRSQREHL